MESHLRLRKILSETLGDPRFSEFKEDLAAGAALEIRLEELGRDVFKRRLDRKLSLAAAANVMGERKTLPILLDMQAHLKKVEDGAMKNWQQASAQAAERQARSHTIMKKGLIIVGLLMTLLMAAMWALLRQKRQLDASKNRLLEKEQMISNARKEAIEIVAHDLRGPLGSIRMCFDMVESAEKEELSMLTRIGRNSSDTALRLIEQILDHTKIEREDFHLEKSPCEIKKMLSEQIGMLETLCKAKEVSFVANIDAKIETCVCDWTRLCQVLANLVGNALKFSERGRKIELEVTMKQCELVFSVRDEGPGIPASEIEHIFDRYWHGPSKKKSGLGWGLAICRTIVDAHGGKIWVTSEEGKGSVFQFTIPLS